MPDKKNLRSSMLLIAATLTILCIGLLTVVTHSPAEAATTIFVDIDAGGANNGTSWANAYTSLQTALSNASSGDQIWVAAGVYLPGNSENDSFQLKNGVEIYGGFAGNEGSREARNWENNVTVLSGDIDSNDTKNGDGVVQSVDDVAGRNSYHIIEGSNIDNSAVLDGFSITAGVADGVFPNNQGAAIHNGVSSPTLRNLVFSANTAENGGAVYNGSSSDAQFVSVEFINNEATSGGGAVYNLTSMPVFNGAVFNNNSAFTGTGLGDGGALYNWQSDTTIINSSFSNNSVDNIGGAIYTISSTLDIDNSSFSNNSAEFGGGLGSYDGTVLSLDEVQFFGNSADSGGGIYTDKSSLTLNDATFSRNTAVTAGGGVFNNELNENKNTAQLNRVTFTENTVSEGKGGGVHNFSSNPVLVDIEFRGNEAKEGGAASNLFQSSASYTNVLFSGNRADSFGGAVTNEQSPVSFVNATFTGNNAGGTGGAIFNNGSSLTFVNTIVWNNSKGDDEFGRGTLEANIINFGGSSIFSNSIVHASGGSNEWDENAGIDGGNNLDADPLFKTPIDLDSIPTTVGDMNLTSGSPAINTGDKLQNGTSSDLAGNSRVEEGEIEMGPYEVVTVNINITTSGVGFGAVTGPNLSCALSCTEPFVLNDVVTMTGDADHGYTFLGWTGDCTGTGPCILTMDTIKNVNAEFGIDRFNLSVNKSGTGVGNVSSGDSTINCGESCVASYQFLTDVTLNAVEDVSSTFEGWSGACVGLGPCTVSITDTRNVTAEFQIIPITTTVTVNKLSGEGNVTSEPTGIECNFDCEEVYDYGTELTLTANPEINTNFTGWSGDCTGTELTCVITLTENISVTAGFDLKRFDLTVTKIGSGTGRVWSSDGSIFCGEFCSAEVDYGTVLTFTVDPDVYPNQTIMFESWGGDCSGTGECELEMLEDKNVIVRFESNIKFIYLPMIRRDE